MYKVNLWMLVEGKEFYDSIEFNSAPSTEELGSTIYHRHNNMTAYCALHGNNQVQSQADRLWEGYSTDYTSDFKSKIEAHLQG